MYNSSGDEMYNSDQSLSQEELSPPSTGVSSPSLGSNQSQNQNIPQQLQSLALPTPIVRRRRSTSLIAPAMGKFAAQNQSAVLAELPSFSADDYELFSKGLNSVIDNKHEDITQVCRAIRDGFLPHLPLEEVENCYRQLHKILKQKPAVLAVVPVGSPKRRRTSKPELPINMPLMNEGPLPNILSSGSNNFASFMGGMSNISGSSLPPPQYMNTNSNNNTNNNSSVTLLPFQPPLMGMNTNMNMNMRPMSLDYSGMPSMASLQISNMGMGGLNNMGMLDLGSPNFTSSNSSSPHHWNNFALSFDLHQNAPSSLSIPQGAPLVSSLN